MDETRVGVVTHFFSRLRVASVRLEQPVAIGDRVHVKGHGDDFKVRIKSMQINRQPVERADAGQEVGILLGSRAHEGDEVLKVEGQRSWWSRLLGS
ncbi:MAG TPA: hypothetical protein VGR28_06715 [Candidatus Thermoplasmatota archaeon]|jgi:putative protease|nr:hypothetical protein [Candidatus Thermoplasmatota archaeon]